MVLDVNKALMVTLFLFTLTDQFQIKQFVLGFVRAVNDDFLFFILFRNFLFSGSLNLGEDSSQFRNYLRDRARTPPRTNRKIDELARHYMYTSAQQASFDEVPWGKMIAI
jgi:hypothetical protein